MTLGQFLLLLLFRFRRNSLHNFHAFCCWNFKWNKQSIILEKNPYFIIKEKCRCCCCFTILTVIKIFADLILSSAHFPQTRILIHGLYPVFATDRTNHHDGAKDHEDQDDHTQCTLQHDCWNGKENRQLKRMNDLEGSQVNELWKCIQLRCQDMNVYTECTLQTWL